jgi:transposase
VGSYVGLTPREHSSSKSNPQLRITKCGDKELRRLLVSSATWILTHGKDSSLRRLGERIRARQDQTSRGKARIAVARKLAVTLHQLWKTGEVYQPMHGTEETDVA